MSEPFLRPGALVAGRYLLEQHLGEGGMGTVWEATHTVTRRSVAMKFLKDALKHKADLRQRFLREASAASALRHPNVVEVLDVFDVAEGVPVLVMELLRGETLGAKLQRDERLSVEETAAIVLPLVSAVGAAHAAGVVHRDLKPDNVFLAESPTGFHVKVLDFGIAKLSAGLYTDPNAGGLHTDTGALLGTPCYMAPEQATGEVSVDHRVDIWSIGVILYECLSGVRPIEGENLAQLVSRLVSAGIVPLDRVAPELPHDVTALVMQMLTRDPSRRLPDLSDAGKLLARYTRVSVPPFGAPVTGRISTAPQSLRPQTRIDAGQGADPRGPTLISSPPVPSSVTLSESPKRPAQPSFRQVLAVSLTLVAVGLLLFSSIRGWFRGSDAASAAAAPPPPAESKPAANAEPVGAQAADAEGSSPATPSAASTLSGKPRPSRPPKRNTPQRTGSGAPAAAAKAERNVTTAKPSTDEGKLFDGRK